MVGNVTGDFQSNNGLFGGSAMLSGTQKGFYFLGRASYREAKNYENSIDGRVYGTSFRETDGTLALGVNKSWGYSHLDLSLYNDVQAIPDGSRDSATRQFTKQITEADTVRPIVSSQELNSYNIPVLHQLVQMYRAFSANSFNIGPGRLAVNVGFERSVRREFSHPEAGDVPGLYLKLNTYTYDAKYFFTFLDGWEGTVGVNGMYQTNDVYGRHRVYHTLVSPVRYRPVCQCAAQLEQAGC